MKKRILVIALLSTIVIVIATIIILNIKKSKSESEFTEEVQEQEQNQDRLPISEDMFDGATGEMTDYTTTTDDSIVVSHFKERFEELIPEHLQDLYLFGKDINISFVEVRCYPDSQQICFSVDNTDLWIIMTQYYISEADYDELACVNKYGTDYSNIYWEDGVPDDAFEVYNVLYENSATNTYIASKSDTGYVLKNCYTNDVTTVDIVDGVYTWSGAK